MKLNKIQEHTLIYHLQLVYLIINLIQTKCNISSLFARIISLFMIPNKQNEVTKANKFHHSTHQKIH